MWKDGWVGIRGMCLYAVGGIGGGRGMVTYVDGWIDRD